MVFFNYVLLLVFAFSLCIGIYLFLKGLGII